MSYSFKSVTGGYGYMQYNEFISTFEQAAKENRKVQVAYEDAHGERTVRYVIPLEVVRASTTRELNLKAIDLEKNQPRNFVLNRIWAVSLGDVLPETDTDVAMQMFHNFFTEMGINPDMYRFEVTYNKPSYETIGLRAVLNTNEFVSFEVRVNKKMLNREGVAQQVSFNN